MTAKYSFKRDDSQGLVKCNIDGKVLNVAANQTVTVKSDDPNLSYFLESKRWKVTSTKKEQADDVLDDGINNDSNNPTKKKKGGN